MTVEFKSKDPASYPDRTINDGSWVGRTSIYTKDLPVGTPTEIFNVSKSPNGYEVNVGIRVEPNRIRLYRIPRSGQAFNTQPSYEIRHVLFPKGGLPVRVIHEDKEHPGVLKPLPSK